MKFTSKLFYISGSENKKFLKKFPYLIFSIQLSITLSTISIQNDVSWFKTELQPKFVTLVKRVMYYYCLISKKKYIFNNTFFNHNHS